MKILKDLSTSMWVFLGLVIIGVIVWVFITGLMSAATYSLAPFYMSIGEWDAFFRVILYLYTLAAIGCSIGIFIDL